MRNEVAAAQDALALLKNNYMKEMDRRLATIESLLVIMEERPWRPEDVSALRHEVHKLAGTGAIYGFPEVSRTGKALERYLEGRQAPTRRFDPLAQSMLTALRQVAAD